MARLEASIHACSKSSGAASQRIEDVAWFFGDELERADDDGKRGPEKRRQVRWPMCASGRRAAPLGLSPQAPRLRCRLRTSPSQAASTRSSTCSNAAAPS